MKFFYPRKAYTNYFRFLVLGQLFYIKFSILNSIIPLLLLKFVVLVLWWMNIGLRFYKTSNFDYGVWPLEELHFIEA